MSLRLNLRRIRYESSIFFKFNIEGYGEFFSGIHVSPITLTDLLVDVDPTDK
jgi:hypothetical protein